MIKTVFISNVLESFYRTYQELPAKQRQYWMRYDSMEGNRALFYKGDDKVIITPYLINPKHLHTICQLMGWKNVANLSPAHSSYSICEDCMVNRLKLQLVDLIKSNPGIDIIPYRATPEFYRLISFLEKQKLKFKTSETVDKEQEFILKYSHCKRGFRHLWSKALASSGKKLKISIPEGFITGNKEEAMEAAWWFQQQKRSFVIKYNKGTQGIGILINRQDQLPHDRKKFIKLFNNRLAAKFWDEPSIIVEEFIPADKSYLGGSPSIEFFIDIDGKVIPTYAAEQILDDDKKTFRGVYIHREVMEHPHIKTAFAAGMFFGKELAYLGYKGIFDVDLVISHKNKLYAVESNMRRTGGTHVHEAAETLLGKDYWQHYHVIGEDMILPKTANLNYDKSFNLLKEFFYNKQAQRGLIFCNPDMLLVNLLNLIFIAKTSEDIHQLRQAVKNKLAKVNGQK